MTATNTMGIDIGTSGCKAVVFNKAGKQIALAYRGYSLLHPEEGAAELDSDAVIQSCFEVIREAALEAGEGSVVALGISSQGEAFTAIDRDGKALCNAMVSSDVRSAPYVTAWPREFGEDRLFEITGQTAHPMYTLFKILWLKDSRPNIWSRIEKILCFEDLLITRLGLEPAIGWSLAGRTMLFDVRAHKWSPEILDAVGLNKNMLAIPRQSGSVIGAIDNKISKQLGLAAGAIAVTGGHDQPSAALGSGAVTPGTAMYATGTVECITPNFAQPVFSQSLRKNNICMYDHVIPDRYATVAFSLTGGNLLAWIRNNFGAEAEQKAKDTGRNVYDLLLEEGGDDPSPLLTLPYWTPSGTPYFDTATPGVVKGWRMDTTRSQFFRSLLEGVALEMRLNLQILEDVGCHITDLNAVGGGAKSRLWTQLKADVTGRSVQIMEVTEAGCMGVAMLARAALDSGKVETLAPQWAKAVDTAEPRQELMDHYTARFEEYKQLYAVMREDN